MVRSEGTKWNKEYHKFFLKELFSNGYIDDIWSCQRFEIKNTHFIFSQSYLYEEDINESSNKQISIKLNDFPLFTLAELLLETLLVSFCN